MDFAAIDVETANADMSSICQIGIAKYSGGKLIDEWVSFIDPEDYFDYINIEIHGITEKTVRGAPTFPAVAEKIASYLNNSISVCHTHFDRVSLGRVSAKYNLNEIGTLWLDSARVARRVWEDCAWSGYGLANICEKIGYKFRHHDALEDAKASGQVLIAAIKESNLNINEWLIRVKSPIDPTSSSRGSAVNRNGNPEGELYGEEIVFTGALIVPRNQAANLAASIGCTVAAGVTKKTSILVVGNQDVARLGGKDKSAKHLKAEQLICKGQKLRIIKEDDFVELVNHSHT